MPALKPEELPEFLRILETANIERQTHCLLFWQLLTILKLRKLNGQKLI